MSNSKPLNVQGNGARPNRPVQPVQHGSVHNACRYGSQCRSSFCHFVHPDDRVQPVQHPDGPVQRVQPVQHPDGPVQRVAMCSYGRNCRFRLGCRRSHTDEDQTFFREVEAEMEEVGIAIRASEAAQDALTAERFFADLAAQEALDAEIQDAGERFFADLAAQEALDAEMQEANEKFVANCK